MWEVQEGRGTHPLLLSSRTRRECLEISPNPGLSSENVLKKKKVLNLKYNIPRIPFVKCKPLTNTSSSYSPVPELGFHLGK